MTTRNMIVSYDDFLIGLGAEARGRGLMADGLTHLPPVGVLVSFFNRSLNSPKTIGLIYSSKIRHNYIIIIIIIIIKHL